jgi:mRNA interferase MazF
VDLGLAAKIRPALVISVPFGDKDRALVTVVPYTTSLRGTEFEAVSAVPFLKAGAFDAQGVVTIPLAKLMHVMGALRPEQLAIVETCLCKWLGLRAP